MARIVKRGESWYCQIRRKGHKSIGRTFNTKVDAERWSLKIESDMGIGIYQDNRETLSTSLAECLDRYASEILPLKKGANREKYRIVLWKKHRLASKGIGTIRQVDAAQWRDERLAEGISGSTVKKDLAFLSHVFTIAIKEWGMPLINPVAMIRLPKPNSSRDRRLYEGEEQLILNNCSAELKAYVTLAIETAMRRGELVGLQRKWIRGKVAYLPETKGGVSRDVPLSTEALKAINSLPLRLDGRLFEFQADHYSKAFLKACRKAGITGLNLHDLRHEALSRMAEKGLSILELKAIGGHKTVEMLSKYVRLNPDDLANKLGGRPRFFPEASIAPSPSFSDHSTNSECRHRTRVPTRTGLGNLPSITRRLIVLILSDTAETVSSLSSNILSIV
jgi:integrase